MGWDITHKKENKQGTSNEIDNFKERKTSTGTAKKKDNLKKKKKKKPADELQTK